MNDLGKVGIRTPARKKKLAEDQKTNIHRASELEAEVAAVKAERDELKSSQVSLGP